MYSYRTTTGALVYTRITLLRKEEVFCLKWKQEQNKGKEEGNNQLFEIKFTYDAFKCEYKVVILVLNFGRKDEESLSNFRCHL